MSWKYYILVLCMLLGMITFPSRVQYEHQSHALDCCSISSSTLDKDCCSHSSGEEGSENSNCRSHSCIQCTACSSSFLSILKPETLVAGVILFSVEETVAYNYGISYFSSGVFKIWQPPKIG